MTVKRGRIKMKRDAQTSHPKRKLQERIPVNKIEPYLIARAISRSPDFTVAAPSGLSRYYVLEVPPEVCGIVAFSIEHGRFP